MTIEGIESKVMPTVTTGATNVAPVANQATANAVTKTETDSQGAEKKNPFEDKEDLYQIKDVSPEKIKNAVDDINKQIKQTHTFCQFAYHDKTNRISITVKDADTGDVIREIPPEKTLDMIAKAWELAGLMVDEKR